MRDFKGIKRQRNRNRSGGGGGKPQNNANRAFDSNGPDGIKVRGAAQHVYEKYQQLARDAHTSGDRVLAENHLQHAEHYFRVLRAMQPQRPLAEIIGRDQYISGYDIDFEDENAPVAEAESETADNEGGERQGEERGWRDSRQRDERQRDERRDDWRDERRDERRGDDRSERSERNGYESRSFRGPRDERNRDDRNRDDRNRDDRNRDERLRDDRRRDERRDERRDDRPRFERDRGEGRPREPWRERGEDGRPAPEPEAPREPGPVLRADDGEVSHAPAFLQTRAPETSEESSVEARPTRRRRAPRALAGAETPGGDES